LSENRPAQLSDSTTATARDPRGVAVFVHDLFDFLGLNSMARNVFKVVIIPLGLKLLKPHAKRVSRSQLVG
jgi:hypothetical protein